MANKFIPGIASQSLGNPQYHGIQSKLKAAASAGLQSVEIFFEDIAQLARSYESDPKILVPESEPHPPGRAQAQSSQNDEIFLACARQIAQWCLDLHLQIICLQPLMHFEGVSDQDRRKANFEKLRLWIQIAKQLGTSLIQIPSNFLSNEECTSDRSQVTADLRQAAQMGAEQSPPIRFAYEALCWGTHINTWDAAWDLVEAVDMDNFGTCLDTFNIAGRVYADPESCDGRTANAEVDIEKSIQKLHETFSRPENLKKVFYVELCDGEILDAPISQTHDWYKPEQRSRMTWSRNARLFPFETDYEEAEEQQRRPGYLPVKEIFDTLLDVGYEGFISFEVFNRSLNKPGDRIVVEHARRAEKSWQRCAEHIEAHLAARGNRRRESSSRVTSLPSDSHPSGGSSLFVGRGVDTPGIQPRL